MPDWTLVCEGEATIADRYTSTAVLVFVLLGPKIFHLRGTFNKEKHVNCFWKIWSLLVIPCNKTLDQNGGSLICKVNACNVMSKSRQIIVYVLEEVEIWRCLHLKSSINKTKSHLQFLKQPSLGLNFARELGEIISGCHSHRLVLAKHKSLMKAN